MLQKDIYSAKKQNKTMQVSGTDLLQPKPEFKTGIYPIQAASYFKTVAF